MFFRKKIKDGGLIIGVNDKKNRTHYHQYTEGIDIGHVKVNGDKDVFLVNNFVKQVDSLLPTFMTAKDRDWRSEQKNQTNMGLVAKKPPSLKEILGPQYSQNDYPQFLKKQHSLPNCELLTNNHYANPPQIGRRLPLIDIAMEKSQKRAMQTYQRYCDTAQDMAQQGYCDARYNPIGKPYSSPPQISRRLPLIDRTNLSAMEKSQKRAMQTFQRYCDTKYKKF